MSLTVNLWLNNIRGCFRDLADLEFQKLAWVQGVGRVGYDCYTELLCSLYDDYNFLYFSRYFRAWGFSAELVNAFEKFDKELDQFEKEVGNVPDTVVINHPKWPRVVENAQIALIMLDDERSKLNIPDDLLAPLTYDFDKEVLKYRK